MTLEEYIAVTDATLLELSDKLDDLKNRILDLRESYNDHIADLHSAPKYRG